MKFHKYQAAGNDFIIINGLEKSNEDYKALALKLCHRRFGIGADGLLVCKTSSIGDIKMLYYNSDGSQGQMCGNGIRSFSKYIYDYEIVNKQKISVETLAGIKNVDIETDEANNIKSIRVDMGYPLFESDEIPFANEKSQVLEETIIIDGEKYIFSAVNTGVPHVVIFLDNIHNLDINQLGEKIENHPLFPQRTNVNFVQIVHRDNINIYTWERGAGRTLGCGTGSCAGVVIGRKLDLLSTSVKVKTEGGHLYVDLKEDYRIYMSGNASHIASGEFYL